MNMIQGLGSFGQNGAFWLAAVLVLDAVVMTAVAVAVRRTDG
jgi:hypothetical protein